MKILSIVSTTNFRDFTRRATIEAISRRVEKLDVLFFTSFKNILKEKITIRNIRFRTYHFWVPDHYKNINILITIEYLLRKSKWTKIFAEYDVIFFTDPNQAYLLPYISRSRIVYLIRDPNVLQNEKFKKHERNLIQKAAIVLATSRNLAEKYIALYHQIDHPNVHYWPNTVDTNIWDHKKNKKLENVQPLIGVAGNFGSKRTDYELLQNITSKFTDCIFEIAGKIDRDENPCFWRQMLSKPNVKYLGNIPFERLPSVVSQWDIGLITDAINQYTSNMHHNKIYQYLAMGLPVVALKIHNDYVSLYPYVRVADNYHEYAKAMEESLAQSRSKEFRTSCIRLAIENSADSRARDFIRLGKISE